MPSGGAGGGGGGGGSKGSQRHKREVHGLDSNDERDKNPGPYVDILPKHWDLPINAGFRDSAVP